MTNWHCRDGNDVLEQLEADPERGLTSVECQKRLQAHGPNELQETGGRSPAKILWEQFSSAMVLLLIVAAGVSFILDELLDAGVILAIVVINAALGFFQDYRAEKALAALKKMAVPIVRVRRDGDVQEISARELVPGDIILLEVGHQIPADSRLLESSNLKIEEAALTGESEPAEKRTEPLERDDLPLGDRTNMAYMGTVVTYGRGSAVVVATGMETELGQIATSLQTVTAEPTPLQKRLAQLGRSLAVIALGIVAVVFVLGILSGVELRLMLMTSLSLAVAVVPEGLPAVATVALALGARRMFRRKALIRKLAAVETLGSVTVICSDKTGTLTENRMTVTVVDAVGDRVDLTEMLKHGQPTVDADGSREVDQLRQRVADCPALAILLTGAGLCNDAELVFNAEQKSYHAVGDPTEGALIVAAARLGLPADRLNKSLPRIAEIPFDSDRKLMTTIHKVASKNELLDTDPLAAVRKQLNADGGNAIAFTKGAVDNILSKATTIWLEDDIQVLDEEHRAKIATANEDFAKLGMRVLGVAFRPLDGDVSQPESDVVETNLIFVGMLAMIDPPRPEVAEAVARCRTAGIRPVMITGDHPLTAGSIAGELQISTDGRVLTGQQLESMSDEALREAAEQTSVFARVAPKHKLQLVRALQENGQIVAMTGDGVNDAPALKQAHIGVAMGITGTDVSKEASQMVLMDDNFATIVNAVEEGRMVYDNIRKFVKYTMTSNAGEIWVMVLGPLLGMPLPLLPLQILWVNLVTDGLPGLALAVEKSERNTMRRPPYPPSEHVFGRGMGWDIAWIGLLMGIVSLSLGYWYWAENPIEETHWRTIVFTVLTLSQMGNAMAIRSDRDSLFRIGVFSNRPLIGAVLLTLGLQLATIYWKPLQTIFKTQALTAVEMIGCVLLSAVVFWAIEAVKFVQRKMRK